MARNNELREIVVDGQDAIVPLTRGLFATIDAADVRIVSGFNWTASMLMGKPYAARNVRLSGRRKLVLMHREVSGAVEGVHIDHVDGDTLNNRRSNLREATRSQNMRNVGLSSANKSGLKGVHLHKPSGKWRSQIRTDSGRMSLGLFDSPEAAYEAYREAARQLHGEFSRT